MFFPAVMKISDHRLSSGLEMDMLDPHELRAART
jgi:hypothetical protein